MTWGELKDLAERDGVNDETEISEIYVIDGDTLDDLTSSLDENGWSLT